ncbi:MAG: hypothetical protein LUE96_07610 [Lachnospiraceae bacterium]|nr:hypothetical protein [Lachnospiraceae bacterium]
MESIHELVRLSEEWQGKICIFGAGRLGKGIVYEILTLAGLSVDFYCDNYVKEGTAIHEGCYVISPEKLYGEGVNVHVFVAAPKGIVSELVSHGIPSEHITIISDVWVDRLAQEVCESEHDGITERFIPLLGDEPMIKRRFKERIGYEPDLENPRTFNEKLQWLKLHDRKPIYTTMVDKYEAKRYVAHLIGEEYIIPTYGVYDCFDEIDFDGLPKRFVLKCTHDSGSVIICRDKETFDRESAKKKLEDSLKRNFYWMGREWPYKDVKPRIIAEQYMADADVDYKFFCFNGVPKYLYVSQGLEDHETASISFLTLDWEFAPFGRSDFKSFMKFPHKPVHYEEMIDVAKILSKGHHFLRVDLYEINGCVYFSEFTFTPCCGWMPFEPPIWDEKLGDMLDIG